jgi:predicted Zn-dependent protease
VRYFPHSGLASKTLYKSLHKSLHLSPLILVLVMDIVFVPAVYAQQRNAANAIQPVENALSKIMLAEFLLAREQHQDAVDLYQEMAFNTLSPIVLERALSVAISQHQDTIALNIARHWVKNDPKDVPALLYLAHLALKAHDYPLAAQTLDKILNYDADTALDRVLAGIYPEAEQDRQDLLQALMRLDSHDNPSLLVLMAGLDAQNGNLNDALKRVERALKKRPDVTAFMTLKANILIAQDKHPQLEQWLNKQNRLQPKNKSLQLFEVRYLLKQQKQQLALQKLDKMTQRWPNDNEIILLAGLVSIDQQDYKKAEAYLLELLTQDDYLDQAYYYLAINAQRQNYFDAAVSYFQKVEGQLYQSAQKKLVLMMVSKGQLSAAISHLTEQRVNHPAEASFLYQLQIQMLKDNGQLDTARQLLDEALINDPDDPELIYARALILKPDEQKLLDTELERLLSIEPNSPTYLNAYAYTLATQNRRLGDARRLAERASALAPDQAAILDTLGFVALLQKDYATAISILEKAHALSNSVNIALRLAQAYQQKGDQTAYLQLKQQLQSKYPEQTRIMALP